VVRPAASDANGGFETFIKITADGSVTAYNGHVDLGTGIRTRARPDRRRRTRRVLCPRRGRARRHLARFPTRAQRIASETIQITAVPLRRAAAQARQFLIARAAERMGLAIEDLSIEDGLIRGKDNSQRQLWRVDFRRNHPARTG